MPITTLLLDADGVTQTMPGFPGSLESLLHGRATMADLFSVERRSLTGRRDLRADLTAFLRERQIPTPLEQLLDAWHDVHPLPDVLAMMDAVRARGVPVYLATNQQPVRGLHVRTALGYDAHVDGQFHSWELGVAKPDPAFFTAIVRRLGVPAPQTLFIDDLLENAAGAREAGLVGVHHERERGAEGVRAILIEHGLL